MGLIAALRTVYATDKATFKRWSTDGGRLPFPDWDEAKKVDTTCWDVWALAEYDWTGGVCPCDAYDTKLRAAYGGLSDFIDFRRRF
ncbi:MAG: hypothetical protein IKK39_04455 [Thermoguttaceae bacterium]|nr:hypothetical protein [Thermoguttaceae bacterium]MBR4103302.1 hypothetical protein [Thermoguttaceae bacterium]